MALKMAKFDCPHGHRGRFRGKRLCARMRTMTVSRRFNADGNFITTGNKRQGGRAIRSALRNRRGCLRERVWWRNTKNHRIQVFDSTGNYLREWGSEGTAPGQFMYPLDVTVDSSGKVM